MDYAFNVPVNSVSFGNVSISLLRESYKVGHQPCIFPIGNQVDLSAQNEDKDFNSWLQSCLNKSPKVHKRSNPIIKFWHLSNSSESFSDKQILYTCYELDSPTESEINTVKNNYKVIFPSNYNTNLFKEYGCENVSTIPFGFDSHNFKRLDKTYFTDGRISFMLGGKFEFTRKRTEKVIKTWIKKFGNNSKYFLNAAVYNVFLNQDQNKQIFVNCLEGKNVANVQFLGFMPQNSIYNDYINSNDIVISAGTESFGLPEFHAIALGKHGVISNYGGHKEWTNSNNCCLFNPSSKIPVYDGMFFHQNSPWNNGNVFDFNEDEFIFACEDAIKRVENNRINQEGIKLQHKFNYTDAFNKLIQELQN
jgi:glycosyltransferase involved in cell wall biosynthesis